jgi:hypothetical protein
LNGDLAGMFLEWSVTKIQEPEFPNATLIIYNVKAHPGNISAKFGSNLSSGM